jgi:hypothetical protein
MKIVKRDDKKFILTQFRGFAVAQLATKGLWHIRTDAACEARGHWPRRQKKAEA